MVGGLKLAELGSCSPPAALGSDVAISPVLLWFPGAGIIQLQTKRLSVRRDCVSDFR